MKVVDELTIKNLIMFLEDAIAEGQDPQMPVKFMSKEGKVTDIYLTGIAKGLKVNKRTFFWLSDDDSWLKWINDRSVNDLPI